MSKARKASKAFSRCRLLLVSGWQRRYNFVREEEEEDDDDDDDEDKDEKEGEVQKERRRRVRK